MKNELKHKEMKNELNDDYMPYLITNTLNKNKEQPYYRKNLYPSGFNVRNSRIDPIKEQNQVELYKKAFSKHINQKKSTESKSFMYWTKGDTDKSKMSDELVEYYRDRDPFLDVAGPFYGDGKVVITFIDALPSLPNLSLQHNDDNDSNELLPKVNSISLHSMDKSTYLKEKHKTVNNKTYQLPTSLPSVKPKLAKHQQDFKFVDDINNTNVSFYSIPIKSTIELMDDETYSIIPKDLPILMDNFTITLMNEMSINSYTTKFIDINISFHDIQEMIFNIIDVNDLNLVRLSYFHSKMKKLIPLRSNENWENAKLSIDIKTKNIKIVYKLVETKQVDETKRDNFSQPSLTIKDLNIDMEHLYSGQKENYSLLSLESSSLANSMTSKKSTQILSNKIAPILSNQESLASKLESRLIRTKW